MALRELGRRSFTLGTRARFASTDAATVDPAASAPPAPVENQETIQETSSCSTSLTEEEIREKCNISRINPDIHARKIRGEYVIREHYNYKMKNFRRDHACFGKASGINPGVAWPSREEMEDLLWIDKRFGKTFEQLCFARDEQIDYERNRILQHEQQLEENLVKLQKIREDMVQREEKAIAAENQKKLVMQERIREVREQIGYNVDPKDPKFVEIMAMKDAERKQKEREARKQAKKQKMMQKLLSVPKIDKTAVAAENPPAAAAEETENKTQVGNNPDEVDKNKPTGA